MSENTNVKKTPDKKVVAGLFGGRWVIKFSFTGDVPITRRDLNQLRIALRTEHSAYLRMLRVEQLQAKREVNENAKSELKATESVR